MSGLFPHMERCGTFRQGFKRLDPVDFQHSGLVVVDFAFAVDCILCIQLHLCPASVTQLEVGIFLPGD